MMPWLCAFRDEILRHDLMLHIHSKASPQSFGLLWNRLLVCAVFRLVLRP